MAKGKKVHEVYAEKFKKGVRITLDSVEDLIKENKDKITVEIIERGSMSDDSEFLKIKIIIAQ